jgi:hypothetical protein
MEKTLLNIIRDWVFENKKIFWKYEVSSYSETYKIKVANLPNPLKEDITISSHHRLLNNMQKTQLCNVIKKSCAKEGAPAKSCVNIKVEYVSGAVVAAFI